MKSNDGEDAIHEGEPPPLPRTRRISTDDISLPNQKSTNRELMEWLGITFADLLVYLAVAAVVAMFFISNLAANVALGFVALALSIAACPLGMKRDPGVSDFTNAVKWVAYPACVLLVIGGEVA